MCVYIYRDRVFLLLQNLYVVLCGFVLVGNLQKHVDMLLMSTNALLRRTNLNISER